MGNTAMGYLTYIYIYIERERERINISPKISEIKIKYILYVTLMSLTITCWICSSLLHSLTHSTNITGANDCWVLY